MSLTVKIKSDTLAALTAANVILKNGEMCITADRKILKIGDGVKTWEQLQNLIETRV